MPVWHNVSSRYKCIRLERWSQFSHCEFPFICNDTCIWSIFVSDDTIGHVLRSYHGLRDAYFLLLYCPCLWCRSIFWEYVEANLCSFFHVFIYVLSLEIQLSRGGIEIQLFRGGIEIQLSRGEDWDPVI